MEDSRNCPEDKFYIVNDRQLNRIKLLVRFCIKNVPDINTDKLTDLLQELILLEDIDDYLFDEEDIVIETQTYNFEELLNSTGIQNHGDIDTNQ
mgnify:CR=1 FL=1|tara:strand:- start:478 stop:759 length:282 start_codon:yes stop_codon:yes gene_type:complete